MFIIVSYDVVDNKQRTKLAKKMCNFGRRVQFSVFECLLDKKQYKEMKQQALQFIDASKDSIRFYRLCEECLQHIESVGIKRGFEKDEDKAIIV
jgi:CRISPR-associated protein Cas2